MEIGRTIAALRNEKGILQKELASYLNVSISTVSNYEKGIHSPDLNTLCRLADYFGVTADYLLERNNFRYDPQALSTPLSLDYTVADLVNTTLEFSQKDKSLLLEYVKLLKLRKDIQGNSSQK